MAVLHKAVDAKVAILEIWSNSHVYLFTPASFIALNFAKQVYQAFVYV